MAGPVNPSRGSRARMMRMRMRMRRDELEEFLPSVTLSASPVQARSGSDQARALWSGFLLCWDSVWWWFGRVVYTAGRASA